MKKIVFIEKGGQYNAIGYMLIHIAEAFKAHGYETVLTSYDYLKQIDFKIDADYIFSINGHIATDNFGEILKKIKCPWISYLVDNPYYHFDKFTENADNFLPVVMDYNHLIILKNFFNVSNGLFMPMGAPENIFDNLPDINLRKIPIAFFGSLASKNDCRKTLLPKWNNHLFVLEWLDRIIVEYSTETNLLYTDLHFDEIKKKFFRDFNIDSEQKKNIEITLFQSIDLLFRTHNRVKILSALKNLPVAIFGNFNPEDFSGHNFIINKSISFDKALTFMRNTAIVLNISPCMYNAISERIAYSMALGNIIVSDTNDYIRQHFESCNSGYFFENAEAVNLKNAVQNILNNPQQKSFYSKNAREEFLKNHTWKIRIEKLIKDIRTLNFEI